MLQGLQKVDYVGKNCTEQKAIISLRECAAFQKQMPDWTPLYIMSLDTYYFRDF